MADSDRVPSTPGENEFPSGFPHSICDEAPQDKYLCSSCGNVLNRARQTLCGHRYCLACVSWLLRNNENLVCRRCKEEDPNLESENSILSPDNFFVDAAINKEILELNVHCANQGCTWRGILKNYEDHQSQCDYALIPCNIGCGHMVERKKLASHLKTSCPNNKAACPTCSQSMNLTEQQKHMCPSPAKEKKKDKKEKNSQPLNSRKKEQCCFSKLGCTFKGTAEKLKDHETTSHLVHLQLLLQATSNMQALLMESARSSQKLPELGEAMAALQLGASEDAGQGDVEADGGDGCAQVASLAHSLQDNQVSVLLTHRLEELQQKVQICENIITVLNREMEKTQLSVALLDQQNQSYQEIIQHLENQVMEQQRKLVMKDVLLNSLRQRIVAQEEVSYDGTYLWRVCSLSQKMKEAASGGKSNYYSPAFYTSRYGFRVCLRLYLNGDGVGKGTHISLFFVVMKGDYDALLSWPFKYKVTFFLLDQTQKEHVIDAFRPDLSSSSFQRPVTDMNVASGCPLFFPLGKLRSARNAYSKDDTLFIKCVVDTAS